MSCAFEGGLALAQLERGSTMLHQTRRRFLSLCSACVLVSWPSLLGPIAFAERVPDLRDVPYGPYSRNLLDVYLADSQTPTPILIFFHGGGFVAGDKGSVKEDLLSQCLQAGITVVSSNYRFILGPESAPFPAPMMDGARAVQFVRSKAKEWNLDPDRVALAGGSAGACMSIWLGVHDDLADPSAQDKVSRISTRIQCVIGYGGQTTLDPAQILKHIGGNPAIHPSLRPFYGVRTQEELQSREKQDLIKEATALNHVDAGDPPMQLRYRGTLQDVPLAPDARTNHSIHHPMFGKLLKDAYEPLGLLCELVCDDFPEKRSEIQFLKHCFEMKEAFSEPEPETNAAFGCGPFLCQYSAGRGSDDWQHARRCRNLRLSFPKPHLPPPRVE